MSVHIDELGRVDALLIEGTWLGVDPGSLQRHMPMNRSSSGSAVVYRWSFSNADFMAAANDVKAIRLTSVRS